jgi:hypothetical protein
MASFRQHISISAALAFLLLPVSLFVINASLPVTLLASLWCWFAGMLPDIDSDTGRPLDLIFGQLRACLPLLVIVQLPEGAALSTITLVFVAVYYIIKYPVRKTFDYSASSSRIQWYTLCHTANTFSACPLCSVCSCRSLRSLLHVRAGRLPSVGSGTTAGFSSSFARLPMSAWWNSCDR